MTDAESTHERTVAVSDDAVDSLRRRMGTLDPRQIAAWRALSPARRLELAFQAYQFALDEAHIVNSEKLEKFGINSER